MAAKKKTKLAEKQYVTDSSIPIKPFYVKSTKKKTKEEYRARKEIKEDERT